MTTAFPLAWPPGWPRTGAGFRKGAYLFKNLGDDGYRRTATFEEARKKLCSELDAMKATNLVISTNITLRKDGMPSGDAARVRITDPGVAIYFTWKGKAMAMACDRYDMPSGNMRSIGLAIEAMRQLERHGGGVMMERAFEGFVALPPPGYAQPWREVLELNGGPVNAATIQSAYRRLAAIKHPDRGGTQTAMAELNAARDAALADQAEGETE